MRADFWDDCFAVAPVAFKARVVKLGSRVALRRNLAEGVSRAEELLRRALAVLGLIIELEGRLVAATQAGVGECRQAWECSFWTVFCLANLANFEVVENWQSGRT
jgi:hypothetical protein